MAEDPPKQPKIRPQRRLSQAARPQCLISLWQDSGGRWQGRLKSLTDGAEQSLADLSELPALLEQLKLEQLRKDPHAQA